MSQVGNEYVLGTGDDELARLSLQNRLWSDAAHGAWRVAGIRPGWRALDVGCGPGFASFDLASLATPEGSVVGVDESVSFIKFVNEQARLRCLPQLRGVAGDVHALDGLLRGERPFDMAYARWVLCFVRNPAEVVAGVSRVLRPGGRFVVHDYFNYRSMTMAPRRRSFDRAVAATMRSWEERGGNTDVVGELPALFAKHGLELIHLDVHSRVARAEDTMFAWPDVWWRIYAPKLVQMGFLPQADCDELIADLDAMKQGTGASFVQCPPVYELVAIKK